MKIPEFFKSLNPQKAFDTIASGIDKLAFTQQERAEINEKLSDKVATFAEKTLNESTIRSTSRRRISYVIVYSWLASAFLDIWIENDQLTYLWKESALETAFLMVLAFFFTGYYLNGGVAAKRLTNKKDTNESN